MAICSQIFNGAPARLIPIGPDRVLMAIALCAVMADRGAALRRVWRERRGLLLLAVVTLLVPTCSAISAAAAHDRSAIFAILDSYGAIPFALLLLAPSFFRTRGEVRVLLVGLTCTGTYLALTGVLEGLKLYALVWPAYITNPNLGLHFGRARGPFLEAGADGLAMVLCMIAAGMLAIEVRSRRARLALVGFLALSCLGVLFTLTRSVWICLAIVATVGLLSRRSWWKWWFLCVGTVAIGVAVMLSASSSLRDAVAVRLNDDRSGVDRLNANSAAFEILRHHPLTGVGWHQFPMVENDWLWQSDSYALTQTGIPVHNVLLGYAAELGLVGVLVWITMLAAAVWASLRASPSDDSERIPWTLWPLWPVLIVLAWLVLSMFVPITYAFPSSVLWLFLGLGLRGRSPSARGSLI